MLPGLNRTAGVTGGTVIFSCFFRQHGYLLDYEILFLVNYLTIWSPVIGFNAHNLSSVDKKYTLFLHWHKIKIIYNIFH